MNRLIAPIKIAAIILITFCMIQSASFADDTLIKMGGAQIRPDGGYIYLRARSGGDAGKTPYGLFAFDKTAGKWETIGAASNFSDSTNFNGIEINPENFFYSRQGYESLSLGSDTYTAGWKNGRAFVQAAGSRNSTYESEPLTTDSKGSHEYLIKYFYASKIWFDMRVLSDSMLYSEGIGSFDIATKKIKIYSVEDLGFKSGGTIITRMTGRGGDVWIGVSFCDAETCLDHGAISIIKPETNKAQLYTSNNSPLPPGAVLDIVPDEKDVWIATATGLLVWNPEEGKANNYRISNEAVTVSKTALLPSPDKNASVASYIDAGAKIKIQAPSESGFYVSSAIAKSGWLPASSISLKIK